MLQNIERMLKVKSVRDIDLSQKRVLIRVDFNVPLDEQGRVTDDKRIRESLGTIEYAISRGARVLLVSHLGRPKEKGDPASSLKQVLPVLEALLKKPVLFVPGLEKEHTLALGSLQAGEVALLENIRYYPGEEKNDPELAKLLAGLCDVYINDAFGTAHRAHASTHGVAALVPVAAAGFLLLNEIEAFARALNNPKRPLALIIGGAKVSGKLELLKNVLGAVDKIMIGGAMSFTFLKALGINPQKSLVEEHLVEESAKIMAEAKKKNVQILLPVDVVCTSDLKTAANVITCPVSQIPAGSMGVDIGPETIALYGRAIAESQTAVWNGPMGVFEMEAFARGTFEIAHILGKSSCYSFIGGGDTADAIARSGEEGNMDYISTGGGASLEILEGKVLPAYEVLVKD